MGRKPDRIANELHGGELSHNPFAALGGKRTPSTPAGESTLESSASAPGSSGQKIVVRFEAKGHGGKTVTRITGLDIGASGLARLAKELKKAMGTGARVSDGDILVQGKAVERVAKWLVAQDYSHVVRGN